MCLLSSIIRAKVMLKGQSSKFFRGFFYASSHGDCLYHCTFKTEMQQRNCPFFIAQRSCSHHSSSGAAHFQRTSRQSPTACSFRPFPIGRLSLREGTFVSSRRDIRSFPRGRLLCRSKNTGGRDAETMPPFAENSRLKRKATVQM